MSVLQRIVVACLAALQLLTGLAGARGFVVCICEDGGIVVEATDERCRCADRDGCCSDDETSHGSDASECSCGKVLVTAPATTRAAEIALPHAPDFAPAEPPRWLAFVAEPVVACCSLDPIARGADPPDPLEAQRTIVLRC